MSAGKHGLQPTSHDHFTCDACNRGDVHADPERLRYNGEHVYDAHSRAGCTVDCLGRGKPIPAKYLHRARVAA